MRSLIIMFFVVAIFAACDNSKAAGLFTKVDTYTLEGMGVYRINGVPGIFTYQVNLPNFADLAACEDGIINIKNREYTPESGVGYSNLPQIFAGFDGTCHKVKTIVPVESAPAP